MQGLQVIEMDFLYLSRHPINQFNKRKINAWTIMRLIRVEK